MEPGVPVYKRRFHWNDVLLPNRWAYITWGVVSGGDGGGGGGGGGVITPILRYLQYYCEKSNQGLIMYYSHDESLTVQFAKHTSYALTLHVTG